jgi:hypothetical protein
LATYNWFKGTAILNSKYAYNGNVKKAFAAGGFIGSPTTLETDTINFDDRNSQEISRGTIVNKDNTLRSKSGNIMYHKVSIPYAVTIQSKLCDKI